jgi:hypothetical protein
MPPKKAIKSDETEKKPKVSRTKKIEENTDNPVEVQVEKKTRKPKSETTEKKINKVKEIEPGVESEPKPKAKAKAKAKSKAKEINIVESDAEQEQTCSSDIQVNSDIDNLLETKKNQWNQLSLEIQALNIKRNELEQKQKKLITELTQLMKKIDKETEVDPLVTNIPILIVEPPIIQSINIDSNGESDDSDSSTPKNNITTITKPKTKKPIVESESESDSD